MSENVQQVSPEAAIWVARRGMVLDYLNEQQPVDQGHNKRMAGGVIRLMQEWDSMAARVNRATFRERYELQRQVEAVRALADEMVAQSAGSHDEDDDAYRDAAARIRLAIGDDQ